MKFMDVIDKRISVRRYEEGRDIEESLLKQIITCGHKAPSAGNLMPWEFIIVKDYTMKRKIVDTTIVSNYFDSPRHQEWLMTAPVFVVVVANKPKSYQKYRELAVKKLVYLDCSACIENMLLAAVNFGLGSCYISGFRERELSKLLGLPYEYETVGFIPLGYPKGKAVIKKKSPVQEVIHYESFGNLHSMMR